MAVKKLFVVNTVPRKVKKKKKKKKKRREDKDDESVSTPTLSAVVVLGITTCVYVYWLPFQFNSTHVGSSHTLPAPFPHSSLGSPLSSEGAKGVSGGMQDDGSSSAPERGAVYGVCGDGGGLRVGA